MAQATDTAVHTGETTTPDSASGALPVHSRIALSPLFEGSEHLLLGNGAELHFPTGDVPAVNRPLYVGSDFNGDNVKYLTYGQVVTLGGDFYGNPKAPISTTPPDPLTAFQHAYASLTNANITEVNNILGILDEEIQAVRDAIAAGKPPSSAYAQLGDKLSYEWNIATGGKFGLDPNGRYLALAAVNWDHFGDHAVIAYRAGHTWAMQTAAAIQGSNKTAPAKLVTLGHAYAINAFADHFLTDLFSAGHLRTPRKELYDQCTPGTVGSLLARCMHDEDCMYGLIVHNSRGEMWTAYGDKRLRDKPDADNLQRVQAAVQASVDDVWAAYQTQSVPQTMRALDMIPDLARARDRTNRENHSPLFTLDNNGRVQCRKKLSDVTDFEWGWFACATTLAELKVLGWPKAPTIEG
jgi:hypothetical protein